jgi:hypothetical protein
MQQNEYSLNFLLDDMIRKGLADTSNSWIEKAIRQKNPRISIGVASSLVLVYDKLDQVLVNSTMCN